MIGNGEREGGYWLERVASACTDPGVLLVIGGWIVVPLLVVAVLVVGADVQMRAAVVLTGGIVLLVAIYVAAIRFTETEGLTVDQRDRP